MKCCLLLFEGTYASSSSGLDSAFGCIYPSNATETVLQSLLM